MSNHQPYQEISLYYILENPLGLPEQDFSSVDSDGINHYYFWIDMNKLTQHQIYPTIVKEKIRAIMATD